MINDKSMKQGWTAVLHAALCGHSAMLEYLEQQGAILDAGSEVWHPTCVASVARCLSMTFCVDLSASIICHKEAGMCGHLRMVEMLVERGVSVNETKSTRDWSGRSEENTSELQSLMRTSYAVF